MALTAAQINSIYTALFGPNNLPSAAQLATWEALDQAQGDAAVINGIVASPQSKALDFSVVQLIQFVQGTVPNAAQLQGWVQYLEAGNSLSSMVGAFAASTNFQNNFNNGNPVTNVNAPVTFAIADNIIFQALGTIPSNAQVQAWVNTGLTIAQMVAQFSLGDQYSARTAPFVQNYLTTIAAQAAGLSHGAAPSGTLFGIPSTVTVTDSLATQGETMTAGSSVTFTINTIGVTTGTQETWALTGTAVGEVNGPTSGTVTIGPAGTASVTVNTSYTNIAQGTLTFLVTSVTPNPTDSVTVDAPAIQNFTTAVGETLKGGPQNTIFQGAVDDLTVGQNTYTSVLDSAVGDETGVQTTNTMDLVIFNDKHGVNIVPNATNVQNFEVTDLNGEDGTTFFDMHLFDTAAGSTPFTTIIDSASTNNDNFFNVGNLVNLEVLNSDFPGEGSIVITVVNTVAPGAVTVTIENGGNFYLQYGNTAGMDVVTEFDFVVSGDNRVDLFGAQNTTTITVKGPAAGAPTGSLWIHFNTGDGFYNSDENNLYMLNFVDASGLGGTKPATDNYQFGFDAANIYQGAGPNGAFMLNGAQGNSFIDLNLEVAVADGTAVVGEGGEETPYTYEARGGTFDITVFGTTSSGNNHVYVDSSHGNGETITINANGSDTTSSTEVDTGDGHGGDYIESHGWMAVNQKVTINETGSGNNEIHVVSADQATVKVNALGAGNNLVDIDLWNNQVFHAVDGTAAMVTVAVGDGANNVDVNTDETGVFDDDTGSNVTVTGGKGSNIVTLTMGNDSTSKVTLGNGNNNDVTVNTNGTEPDDHVAAGSFGTTSTITVGTGTGIEVTYVDGGNSADEGWEHVTVTAGFSGGVAGGGSGEILALIGQHSQADVTVGNGNYDITEDMEEGNDTGNVTAGNGTNDITVEDGPAPGGDVANVTVGTGNDEITVNFAGTPGSVVTIHGSSAAGNSDEVTVYLDTAGPASSVDVELGTSAGQNNVFLYGFQGGGVGNMATVNGGAGNDGIFIDSLTLPNTITLNGGGGYNTLGLDGNQTALESGATLTAPKTLSTPALAGASVSNFQALEIFGPMVNGVNVLDLGAGGSNLVNNINQVVLTQGYNDGSAPLGTLLLTGLNNNAELDLLWGQSAGQTLYVPLGNAGPNPVDFFNLMLDSQFGNGQGLIPQTITHHYGFINLEDAVGGGTVTTVNLESTAKSGIGTDINDYANVYNDIGIDDHGLTAMNLWGLGGGDPDGSAASMVGGRPFDFGGAQQDGDAFLVLDSASDLGGMKSFNATNATNGGHGDFLAGFDATFETGSALTVNANQTTEDNIIFGGAGMNGTKIFVGNWDNSITEAAGSNTSNDVITLAQQTASVYGAGNNGSNTVTLNNGTGNTINIDNNPSGAGDHVTIGITHTGVLADAGFLNGDVINLGTGGNVQNDVVTVNGSNSNPWVSGGVPDAIVTVNIDSATGGSNHITMNYVTGSMVNLGTHTLTDTISFNHVTDSAFGYNDTITGFNGATAANHDIIDLSGVIGANTHSFQLANGSLAVAALANGNTAGNDAVIYDYTNGTLYDFHNGATFATATEANTMQIQVGVTGIGHFTANEITF